MDCPKCAAPVPERAEQCPQCGIFFSKWQEREDNVAMGNVARYAASPTSSEFNWTILVIVCLVILGIFYFLELSNR